MKEKIITIGSAFILTGMLFVSCAESEEDVIEKAQYIAKEYCDKLDDVARSSVPSMIETFKDAQESANSSINYYISDLDDDTAKISLFHKTYNDAVIGANQNYYSNLAVAIEKRTASNQEKISSNKWWFFDEENNVYNIVSFQNGVYTINNKTKNNYSIDCDTITFDDGSTFVMDIYSSSLKFKDKDGHGTKSFESMSSYIRSRLTNCKWWQKVNPNKDSNLYSFRSGKFSVINFDSDYDYTLSNDTICISGLETAVVSFSGDKMFIKDVRTGRTGTFIPATEKALFWGEWHWKMMALIHSYFTYYPNGKCQMKTTAALGRISTSTWEIKDGKLRQGNKEQPFKKYSFINDDKIHIEGSEKTEEYTRVKKLLFKTANIRLLFQ